MLRGSHVLKMQPSLDDADRLLQSRMGLPLLTQMTDTTIEDKSPPSSPTGSSLVNATHIGISAKIIRDRKGKGWAL